MTDYLDLTRTLFSGIQVYPGTPMPKFEQAFSIESDGYCETSLHFHSHVGTHIDAPAHLINNGATLDSYPVERFFGRGVVVDLSGFAKNEEVCLDALTAFEKDAIRYCDFILFDTGFDHDLDALGKYAVPSAEILSAAIQNGIKVVGIDRMSIDTLHSRELELHKLLLKNDVLIIENLQGLSKLHERCFSVCALALLYQNADGAPVRVIAWKV